MAPGTKWFLIVGSGFLALTLVVYGALGLAIYARQTQTATRQAQTPAPQRQKPQQAPQSQERASPEDPEKVPGRFYSFAEVQEMEKKAREEERRKKTSAPTIGRIGSAYRNAQTAPQD